MTMKALIIISLFVFYGCATMRSDVANLREGMTPEQVIDKLGKPDGVSVEGEKRTFQYIDRWVTAAYTTKADYYMVFTNNKLTAYGTTEIRPRQQGNVAVVIPAYPPPQESRPPLSPVEYQRAIGR